jgi:predicted dehydrogenase
MVIGLDAVDRQVRGSGVRRIKIGVIGAGAVAQIEHLPNFLKLKDCFDVLGVCDPSATAREFVASEFGLPAFASVEAVLGLPIEAVVIASPDPLHHEQCLAALARGLHVFCEKPLCYGPADIDEVIAARDRAGRVLQVGYMKRFDPAYETALELMPGSAATLRQIAVEVNDPDAWPFIRHHNWRKGDDVPSEGVKTLGAKQKEQVARAIKQPLDASSFRGFCNAYCSALVHDVNAVHGMLDRLGAAKGEIAGAQLFANGDGGQGAVRLSRGRALWTMSHLTVPSLPDYRERITLYFDDASLELEFPSPWLNHHPTRLTIKKGKDHRLVSEEIRVGYEEAFVRELKGFWSAIAEGKPVRNTAEDARRDMELLCRLAQWHATHSPQQGDCS